MNVKVFHLISEVNEARLMVQQELTVYSGLNKSACNSKQKWNPDECWFPIKCCTSRIKEKNF